jgi:transposase InsO family protein
MAKKGKKKSGGGSSGRSGPFSYDLKLRAVKLYLEEGYSKDLIAEELGVGKSTLTAWAKQYREEGEDGLRPRPRRKGKPKVSPAAKRKAVELKRRNPEYGCRRISHLLRRMFFLKASPETVRQTLQAEDLVERVKSRPKRNPPKPRFFERSRPNQMWQSDIFTFRLGGRNAYLIGYLDDYSRYLTGAGLYRSQTAECVLEVYRRAIAEYGVPKEMLTDNGRQYTNWRGTTRFEAELKKDRVAHIKSRPHHPMTLGKIERFWKSIFTEFLSRVQFDSFEEARERLLLWVKYYNHKRPHQGIGGLCPADRFYEIQSELKKVVERGIAENVLETALRGRPQKPFYMVGRMGEQSVVIRAEKGKVKMLVDGQEGQPGRELVYAVKEEQKDESGEQIGQGTDDGTVPNLHGAGEDRGGAGGVVGAAQTLGAVPTVGDQLCDAAGLATPGAGSDDAGAGTADERRGGSGPGPGPEAGEAAGADEPAGGEALETGAKTGENPDSEDRGDQVEAMALPPNGGFLLRPEEVPIVKELLRKMEAERSGDESERPEAAGPTTGPGTVEGRVDPEGPQRTDDGRGGGEGPGGEPQDVLQVGETGAVGNDGGPLRARLGPAGFGAGRGEGDPEEEGSGVGAGTAAEAAERAVAQAAAV